jgi:isopenicillin N synthase-like dioxygenase
MPLEQVPVIDIAPFIAGGRPQKQKVADEIRRACEEIGFFTIAGHGVPEANIEEARRLAFAFFDLPMEEKRRIERPPSKVSRGYTWVGDRGLAYSLGEKTAPDLQESFGMGPIDGAPPAAIGTPAENAFFLPNMFPERPAGFRKAFETLYRDFDRTAVTVLRIFAVALGLDEHAFDGKVDRHTSTFRAILYPPQLREPEPGQLRAGAHSDYGTLTVLRGDDVPGGLQVKIRSGEWVDVHPPKGTLVCNIGDLMMRWTNDRWLSNLHRVANPPREHAANRRMTIVFFQNPNFDAEIKVIDPAKPPKYEPMRFGDYYLGKHMKAQHLTVDDKAAKKAATA